MVPLNNGCARSEFNVSPAGWDIDLTIDFSTLPEKLRAKQQKAFEKKVQYLLSQKWRINYRYYDPAFKGTTDWGKLIPIKGMNSYRDLTGQVDFFGVINFNRRT